MATTQQVTAEVIADVMRDALAAFEDGRSPREVGCRRVGGLVHSDVVAHARFDTAAGTGVLDVWPDRAGGPPRSVVTREPRLRTAAVPGPRDPWSGSAAAVALRDHTGVPHTAVLPLVEKEPLRTLAVFGSRRPWGEEDRRVLDLMRPCLAALEAHVRHVEASRSLPGQGGPPSAGGPPTAAVGLTPRELEVLRLLSHGLLAATIAARMTVSPRTVHKHLGSVYRKLDTHDRLLAVERARALGLL